MAAREQRHARGSSRSVPRRILGWVPDVLVLLVVGAALAQAQYGLAHRWFGLEQSDPAGEPAEVAPPTGLDLAANRPAPEVAAAVVPGTVDAAAVRKALAPVLADAALGPHAAFQVMDLSTGKVVFRRGASSVTPASTMKLLTTTAALTALGPGTRFSTRVVGVGSRIVLVGGGDPFLASTPARAKGQYPARGNLTTLAQRTAAALTKAGIRKVALGYDASLFSGPAVNPHWPSTYVPESVVPPISALWVDEGGDGHGRYVADPAQVAADDFAAALKTQGIAVVGAVRERKAPGTATELAVVKSSPLGEIVQQTLAMSDNNAAEVIARHVGAKVLGDASFAGGTKAIFSVLDGLGVDTAGSEAYDGSGLSRETRLTATTLIDVLKVATSSADPKVREVITGLPVAGFTGSLQRRFDQGPDDARGRVRAKTGTLTGVHGLAGIAADLDGDLMAFVFVADQVPVVDTLEARHDLDLMAGALGACHCGT